MRLDPVLLVSAAAFFGGLAAVSPIPVAVAMAAVGLLFWRPAGSRVLVLAALAALLCALRAEREVEDYVARWSAARDALVRPSRCAGTGVVRSSPRVYGERLTYVADFDALDCEGRTLPGPFRVRLYGGPADLGRGDRVEAITQLAPVRLLNNPELRDPRPPAARSGAVLSGGALSVEVLSRAFSLRAFIDRARAHARGRIVATFSPAAEPMARALVLGEDDLSEEDTAAFRLSGLAHLLAVSGTHLVFAVVALVRALTAVLVRIERLAARTDVARLSAAAGVVLALLYADFSGGTGSAWRAAWMLAASFAARALWRPPRIGRALAISLVTGVAYDPLAAFDLSFVLSLAATVGLVVLGQRWARPVQRWRSPPLRYAAGAAIACVASMIPCAPLLLTLAPNLTLAGIVANVLAAPFGEVVALPLCLSHALLTPLPALEEGVALVASGALLVVCRLAHLTADMTWLAADLPLPGPWHFVVLAVGTAGWLSSRLRGAGVAGGVDRLPVFTPWNLVAPPEEESLPDATPPPPSTAPPPPSAPPPSSRGARRLWLVALALALAVVEGGARLAGSPRGVLRVTAVDVGQGDSLLIDLPDGALMLVDGGGFVGTGFNPGERVLEPLLRARRRGRIDVAVLSHPHPDHYLGLAAVLRAVEVGELWDSGQGEDEGAGPEYHAMLADLRRRGVPIRRPADLCGPPRPFGAAAVDVLGPCPEYEPHINPNDNSLVLRIRHGRRAVLLTGDAEAEQEARLLATRRAELAADLLKVGHHGSRTSTAPDFLEAVAPALAVMSCGVRNRFGHPHPNTLDTLARAGVPALRTDLMGSVIWTTDGEQTELRVAAPFAAVIL